MRSLFIFIWCSAILIFTCTVSFHDLIHFGVVSFQWDSSPSYSAFFSPFPAGISRDLMVQKLGHVVVFLVLTVLLLTKFRSNLLILFMAASFASLTEFLQLHFTRGGRLFDICFDLTGILIAIGIASFFRIKQTRELDLGN
jgi:VanZ family protein